MRSGTKNVLPTSTTSSSEVDYTTLQIPAGPWNEDLWRLDHRPGGTYRSVPDAPCHLEFCDGVAYLPAQAETPVCYGHYHQWRRARHTMEFERWLTQGAKPLLQRRRPPSFSTSPLDLRRLPGPARAEMRLVVGTKIRRGDWTPNDQMHRVLEVLVRSIETTRDTSFLDRRFEDWLLIARSEQEKTGWPKSFDKWYAPYYRTFFATLHRALITDPWSEEKWLWRGCFENVLGSTAGQDQPNLDWGSVEVAWLRRGAMRLAEQHLKAGTRRWATLLNWRRALVPLSDYLVAEGLVEPGDLWREVFLDYLGFTREGGASKNTLQNVTTAAKILEMLRADGIVRELPTDIYLRHGENAVRKASEPSPYPQDVIDRIDDLLRDSTLDRTVRAMLLLLRWGCPRISELISMPIDALRHNGAGGYWIEYWQDKTSAWRRFPIPDELAHTLRAQQDWVLQTYVTEHSIMFPAAARSNLASGTARPWTAGGFRTAVRAIFQAHGITHSQMTGEVITGGHIHRYRHTVGTTLLNNNWTMPEVQEFFAHASSTMTAHYAKITHSTLVKKAHEFHHQQVEDRTARRLLETDATVERMRTKFTAVLPDGYCQLPDHMKCDYRRNPCKDCSFYDPGGDELAQVHAEHRTRLTITIAKQAAAGQTGAQKINEQALSDLDTALARHGLQERE